MHNRPVTNQLRCVCDGSNPGNFNKILRQISRFCTRRRRSSASPHPSRSPTLNLKFEDCSQEFSPILGIPDKISDDLRCPPINRRRPPSNLRLVARFYVGLEIQVEIQCLRVVSGDLRLNRRRPATIRTLSVYREKNR